MKRTSLTAPVLLASALALSGGCVEDGDESLVILKNLVPDENCIADADSTDVFRTSGQIDTSAEFGYVFTPLVQSTAISSTQASRLTFMKKAKVDLKFQEGFSVSVPEFDVPLSGVVEPDGDTVAYSFEVIPKTLLNELASQFSDTTPTFVNAEVTMVGEMDGSTVTSNTFVYPIQVCNGCMKIQEGPCADLPANVVIEEGGLCNDMQDDFVTCCTDGAGVDVCPADPNAGLDCADSVLTFDNFGQAFMDTFCQGCHASTAEERFGAPPNVTFDDRAQVEARADRIMARAGVGTSMPPSGAAPDSQQRADLVEWLSCGVQ